MCLCMLYIHLIDAHAFDILISFLCHTMQVKLAPVHQGDTILTLPDVTNLTY
jgi:hypothetical protein